MVNCNKEKEEKVNFYMEKLRFLMQNMISKRPVTEVELYPYNTINGLKRYLRREVVADLNEIYSQSVENDRCFVSVLLKPQYETDIWLITDGVKNIYTDGVKIPCGETRYDGRLKTRIHLKSGGSKVIMECVKSGSKFFASYMASHLYFPFLWVSDYLLWVKDEIPLEEYGGEQGIAVSRLYKPSETVEDINKVEFSFPGERINDETVDFSEIFGTGHVAAAYSEVKQDGEIEIHTHGKGRLFVNGSEKPLKTAVNAGDKLLLTIDNDDKKWGFECKTDNLHLPMLSGKRADILHWLILKDVKNINNLSENIQFKEPYETTDNKKSFWQAAGKNTYIRPYMNSSFFGQWFYGLMVGQYGILCVSEFLPEYREYFKKGMELMVNYHDYMLYDAEKFGNPPFIPRCVKLCELDAIGTIGMNIYELMRIEDDKEIIGKAEKILDRLVGALYSEIPRMADGTFYRKSNMWADDLFMSCPFLVRMGQLENNEKYYDEAATQLLNYKQLLYMEKEHIYAHIYLPEKGVNTGVPWGRGNGWVLLTLAEVLEHLPKNHRDYDKLMEMFVDFAEGLAKLQGDNGLWHQVLNMESSYYECSCSAIFATAFGRGVRYGWLDKEKFLPIAENAVNGILNTMIDGDGNVMGVCRGSGCSADANYYASLETVCNDDHGTGLVLTSMCELIKNYKKESLT